LVVCQSIVAGYSYSHYCVVISNRKELMMFDPAHIQIAIGVGTGVGVAAVLGVGRSIGKKILSDVGVIKNQQKYTHFHVVAMDHALEKGSKNGYCDARDAKLDELVRKDEFVYKSKG
jgi:hypothetical protein